MAGTPCFDICPECGTRTALRPRQESSAGVRPERIEAVSEELSRWLEDEGRPVRLAVLRTQFAVRTETLIHALRHLMAGGYAIESFGSSARGGTPKIYEHVRPYRRPNPCPADDELC